MIERDTSSISSLVTEDIVEDWPPSGQRIRGAATWTRVGEGHLSVRRIVGAQGVWGCEADFDYGGETGVWSICSVLALAGDLVARVTQSFGAPFPAADWRSEMTEHR